MRGFEIKRLSKEEWAALAADAHKICFAEKLDPKGQRIDFALLAVDQKTDTPQGYMTAKEVDDETLFLEFGGAFPVCQGFRVWKLFEAGVHWCLRRYDRITCVAESGNVAYLKLAFAAGFRVCGTRYMDGKCYVELLLEKET